MSESSIYDDIISTNKWGFEIGLNVFFLKREKTNFRFSPTISLEQEEITFSNAANNGEVLLFDHGILRLPLHFMIRPTNKELYFLSGFSTNILMQLEKEDVDNFLDLKNYDFSLDFGIGFPIPIKILILTPEIKYGIGLNNILSGDNTTFENSIESFHRNRLSIGISLTANYQ